MFKKKNWFLKLLFYLFIIFIGLFIASESGYYEAKLADKVILTEEAIKKFEKDVLNGEVVDINTYIVEESINYSNSFTKAGDKISEIVESFVSDGISGTIKVVKKLLFG